MASIATIPRIRPRGVQQNYQPVIPALDEGDLDEKLLVRLAFDALTCVDRRISQDQRLLKEKLGPLGDEFDSLLHSVTDKLLLQYPWNDADDFKDILFKLLVADGEICSERFFRRWEASKATDNGKAGLDRWRHYFSARKSQLLFQRRQYIINRPPSVLLGCLSAVDRGEASAGKSLVSREFLHANVGAMEVYAQRFLSAYRALTQVSKNRTHVTVESAMEYFLAWQDTTRKIRRFLKFNRPFHTLQPTTVGLRLILRFTRILSLRC